MDIKKDEIAEIISNEISTENISEAQEPASDIETVAETIEDAVKYVDADMVNGTDTTSDAADSTPDADSPSKTDTTETTLTGDDSALTDSTVTDTMATDPAGTNLTAIDPAAVDPAETDSTIISQTAADPVKTDLAVTDTAAAEPAETDSAEESDVKKNKVKKRKLRGILELTAAALILVFSVYLFLNTRGTRLLFVSVAFGRICRYYWIGLLAAIILGLVGCITLRWHSRAVRNRE